MIEREQESLPEEIADRFTEPFVQFLKIEAAAGALLLLATATALTLTNSLWSTQYLTFWEMPVGMHLGALDYSRSLRNWINDGLMTFFFFVIALELKRELVLGELRDLRMAALPLAGALGGMVVPAAMYFAIMSGQPGMHGWGTVVATDTAFVIGCLALFGRRITPSLRLFLLSLAIFDDVGAIVIVAAGYGHDINWLALGLGLFGFLVVAGARCIGIRSIPVFFIMGGVIWLCFDASGIHPTVVGVVLGLMTPTRGWVSDKRMRAIFSRVLSYPIGDHWSADTVKRNDLQRAGSAASETLSSVERLEFMLHPWVSFAIMPVFALANAGVNISGSSVGQPVTIAIIVGLVFGKPVGVLSFSWFATRTSFATRPRHMSWPILTAGSLLTGIGFTMSLFIAGLAFDTVMLTAAKIGVLIASAVCGTGGILMLGWLSFKKQIC